VNPHDQGWESGRRVLVEWPDQFRLRETLSAGAVRRAEVRMIALRFLCGLEPRSMAAVARQRGVSRNAISAAFTRMAKGLGLEYLLKKAPETRRKLSESTSRWHQRKAGVITTPASQTEAQLYTQVDHGHSGPT
jgi:hypothetical protein